ncbi:hypothetical protein [Microbispora sp. NBRC 16548]|uniref:hypothetical protein n=1 Tax=Microbispora sp. NBRC 16548 TaxID=3030994 RepID=UPI0024A1D33D|nr:hypothetical protein [Microbispora sp. NBRC 16548]GLX03547.1 hypothetical protein Misp03_04740 [Microbispora sp. NBRC 16548]
MGQQATDRRMWEAIIAAEQQSARLRADFYRHAASRAETLSAALRGSTWDRGAALTFLQTFPSDVPALLRPLVELALSQAWALDARRAIARGRRDLVLPRLRDMVVERLPTADAEDLRRMAELLGSIEAWQILRVLVQNAAGSDDPDAREVAEDFTGRYGPMLVTGG